MLWLTGTHRDFPQDGSQRIVITFINQEQLPLLTCRSKESVRATTEGEGRGRGGGGKG